MESTASTPKYLRVRGEEIRCIDAIPPGLIFDIAEVGNETNGAKLMSGMRRFLDMVVADEAQEQLKAMLYDRVNVVPMEDLIAAYSALIAEYTGRPLGQPADSPTGSNETGQISRVVSFSRGTVETVDPSSMDGPPPES